MIGPLPPRPASTRDRRRELWARWSTVSARREAALDADDVDTFVELEAEQAAVEEAVRGTGGDDDGPVDLDDPEVRARMEELLERERRIQKRLRALRADTLDEIRRLRSGVPGQARHARDYIRRDEGLEAGHRGLDLRT